MKKINGFINKISKTKKITILSIIIALIVLLSLILPTFARLNNRNSMVNISSWDGNIATSFRKGDGTKDNPYIISNGNELAYFSEQLKDNNFENKYVQMNSDIIINEGSFKLNNNKLIYTLKNKEYYVDTKNNKYYDKDDFSGNVIGTLNILKSFKNFKGTFDGTLHTISGYYISDNTLTEKALFINLQGNISNLYLNNTYVNDSNYSALLASSATNSTIKNVMVNGIVDNNTNSQKEIDVSSKINDVTLNTDSSNINNKAILLTKSFPTIGTNLSKSSLKGTLEITNLNNSDCTILLNNTSITEGSFNINLGDTLLDNIVLSVQSNDNIIVKLTNLEYDVTYDYRISGGIIGISNNTTLTNVINKGTINGYSTSGGLVAVSTGQINISNSYNKGEINSNILSGGIIGNIENNLQNNILNNTYNTKDTISTKSGGIIGNISNNTGNINISNSFTMGHTSDTAGYPIGSIINSNVTVANSYYQYGDTDIGNNATYKGVFIPTDINNLKNNNQLKDYLNYTDYVSKEDMLEYSNNVWLYEKKELPILFFDDINNPIVNLHASIYSWNNFSTEVDKVGFNSNISFSITNVDNNNPYEEAYYYISKSNIPKSLETISSIDSNIEWIKFNDDDIIKLDPDNIINGQYIIYVKVIDKAGNKSYINSDILILDETQPSVNIQMDDKSWTMFNDSIKNINLDRNKSIIINANDIMSSVKSIQYYKTGEKLTQEQLEQIPSSDYKEYDNPININTVGEQIIYVKVTDFSGNVTYANTDKLILDGYEISDIYAGTNRNNYEGTDITKNSKISIDINYNNYTNENENTTHKLVSNILLPKNTKITLIDFITNKVYTYVVPTNEDLYGYNDSCDNAQCEHKAKYPFTNFKEIGSISKNIKYIEQTYYDMGKVDEDYTVTLDFQNSEINQDYLNSKFYIELTDNDNNVIRPTLYNSIKTFNLYKDNYPSNLYLETDYNNVNEIELNSQSQTNIQINSLINYSKIGEKSIIDTKYENMKIGLGIKLVDELDNTISKNNMDNIIIRYDNKDYYPENDNMFHIDLNNGIKDVTKDIQIVTYENDNKLKPGKYYFKLFNYVSNSGYSYQIINNNVSINAKLTRNKIKYKYEFNVKSDTSKSILNKGNTYELKYAITQISEISNPSIKVSLYKKNNLLPNDQNYTLINLQTYTDDVLNEYINSIYLVNDNPKNYVKGDNSTITNFIVNLNTKDLEKYGYKMVFTLYDGTNIVGSVEKYFIIK